MGLLQQSIIGIAPFHDRRQVLRIDIAHRRPGRRDIFRRLDNRHRRRCVFGDADFDTALRLGTDCLNCETMAEDGIVANLVQLIHRQVKTRRVHPAQVARFHERAKFIHRDEVVDPIGQLAGDITGIVGKGLHGVARLPTAL